MPSIPYHVLKLRFPNPDAGQVLACLFDLGCAGITEENSGPRGFTAKAYFDARHTPETWQAMLQQALPGLQATPLVTLGLSTRDESLPFVPFELAPGINIVPEDMPHGNRDIILRPGLAFGTGLHASTRLAARALTELQPAATQRVLDVGTGSGILALAARRLGCDSIVAVEIDAPARENARLNFGLNGCEDIPCFSNLDDVKERFDLILANIPAQMQVYLKNRLATRLADGGRLILSGAVACESSLIQTAYAEFVCRRTYERGEWRAWVYKALR